MKARHKLVDLRDVEFSDVDLKDPGILALNEELINHWQPRPV